MYSYHTLLCIHHLYILKTQQKMFIARCSRLNHYENKHLTQVLTSFTKNLALLLFTSKTCLCTYLLIKSAIFRVNSLACTGCKIILIALVSVMH